MKSTVPPMDRLVSRSITTPCLIKGLDLPCWVVPAAWQVRYYSQIRVNGRTVGAHRFAYVELISGIPEGLQLDHLCLNQACWNPWHVEPVTREVNLSRGSARLSVSIERKDQINATARYAFFDR